MPSFRFASATGSGSSLIVTCSDQFAGKTITCTNGTKTYTRTCPSTSPYEVVFKGVAPGTWTVSGVVEGTTYSQQVVITDFDIILTTGFDYKQWVTLGGLDPEDYTDLEDVFADEVAVRRLMTIHASADYLIDCVTNKLNDIDAFCANDTAMKWIGLRDYVCDGLTAITGVEAKFLASQYWERYLKDHVPVMIAASAPYGTAFGSNEATSAAENKPYKAFDGNDSTMWSIDASHKTNIYVGYIFNSPIRVNSIYYKTRNITALSARLEGSNNTTTGQDGTWTNLGAITSPTGGYINISNVNYYKAYRLYIVSETTSSADHYGGRIETLQFYGRALDEIVSTTPTDGRPYLTLNNTIYSVSWTEREFAEGSTMKYLYDHGVEFETFSYKDASNDGDKITLGTNDAYAMSAQNNLTNYSTLRAVIGDSNGNGNGYIIIDDTNAPAYSYNTWIAYNKLMNGNNPNTVNLSVASINQSLYCGLITNKALQCKELWLE